MNLIDSITYAKEVISISQVLVALTGVGTFAYGFYRYIIKPTVLVIQKGKDLYEKLDAVIGELDSNNQHSFKSQLSTMSSKLNLVEQFLKTTLDLEKISLFQTDHNGKMIWANKLFLNMVNKTITEVLGDAWFSIICQEERDYVLKEWKLAIEQKRNFYLKFNIMVKDEKKLVYAKTFPYALSSEGPVIGYVGMLDHEFGKSDYETHIEMLKD